jgi:hypothetical protein
MKVLHMEENFHWCIDREVWCVDREVFMYFGCYKGKRKFIWCYIKNFLIFFCKLNIFYEGRLNPFRPLLVGVSWEISWQYIVRYFIGFADLEARLWGEEVRRVSSHETQLAPLPSSWNPHETCNEDVMLQVLYENVQWNLVLRVIVSSHFIDDMAALVTVR